MADDVVPVLEGTFVQDAEGGRIHGNKCKSCGHIYFPKAQFCFECFNRSMEEIVLSRHGKLYTYTIGRMASTHFQPPYAIGLVDMPEGVRVFAPLKKTEDETFKIGMEMELVIEELWREDDKQVIGYKFKPI
jgi:uncharacterized OB-fold protein